MCWLFPNAVRKDRRKTRAWCEIRPLGCRELRAPTWRKLTSLYAARPPRRATRIGALINFIPLHVQSFRCLSSKALAILAVSFSPTDESDPIFYPNLIKARMVWREIRAE